jgi:Beta-lactamase
MFTRYDRQTRCGLLEQSAFSGAPLQSLEKGEMRPLNGDTIFEIGSETKVFTSLLLADMVRRGEVALGDPVAIVATIIASQVPPRVSFGHALRQESTSAKRLEN